MFDLSPGSWAIEAGSPEYWSPPFEVSIEQAGGPLTGRLGVWPASSIHGRLEVLGDGIKPPSELRVGLRPPGERPAFSAQVICPVSDRQFRCRVPRTTLDLIIGADGFSSDYHHHVAPEDFATRTVRLTAGPSIVGRVMGPDGSPLPGAELQASHKDGAVAIGLSGSKMVARSDEHGAFQFVGTASGDLVIEATAPGMLGDRASVTVDSANEVRLRGPLRLAFSRPLRITVDPPRDPENRPWFVELRTRMPYVSGARTVALSPTAVHAENGTLVVDGLRLVPGPHTLRVQDKDGRTWYSQPVSIDGAEAHLIATLDLEPVRGRVRLGDRGVAAQLTFGGEFGAVRVPVKTDTEGRFETHLPRTDAPWNVLVQADMPRLRRSMEVTPVPGEELDIALPETRLVGTVVGPDGRPHVDKAVVEVSRGDYGEQTQWPLESDERGQFELVGFEPGEYWLRAEAAVGQSGRVRAKVAAEGDSDEVELRLTGNVKIRGSVMSPEGHPVAGARFKLVPAQDPVLPVPVGRTDAHGHFEATLPSGTTEAFASFGALGFGFKLTRLQVTSARLEVRLSRASGVLKVRWAEPLKGDEFVNLYRGGAAEQLGFLRSWAAVQGADLSDPQQMEIPAVEAGAWRACRSTFAQFATGAANGPAGQCAVGIVPVGADVALEITQP